MSTLAGPPVVAKTAGRDEQPRPRDGSPSRYVPLLYRITGINALLVVAAVVVTVAVLAPHKVSPLAIDEEVAVVFGAVALVVVVNLYLLRRVVGPVQALTAFARGIDASLAQRMPGAAPTSEAGELALTFNEMLSRLESERRESTRRVLGAQEAERLWIAQELHDQVGQELTAVLLSLSRISSEAPPLVHAEVTVASDAVRGALEDVRRIAIELRPEALDELGLDGALAVLAERFSKQLGLEVSEQISPDLPSLPAEHELVLYRVAQEALTNIVRHASGSRAEIGLERGRDRVILTVRDDGLGLPPYRVEGTGIRGMRERAALIGAKLEIRNRGSGPGAEVRLEVPLREER